MEKQPLGGRKPELWPRPALSFFWNLGQVTSPHIHVLDLYFLTCEVSACSRVVTNTPVCLKGNTSPCVSQSEMILFSLPTGFVVDYHPFALCPRITELSKFF